MKKNLFELLTLDAIVLIVCAIQLQDWLVFVQMFAAASAGIYSIIRIFDFIKKGK